MSIRTHNTLQRLDYIDNEIAQVKLELLRGARDKRTEKSTLVDRIVKEVGEIRSQLYKERYGGKTARVS